MDNIDLKIAQEAKMLKITDIAKNIGLGDDDIELRSEERRVGKECRL